MIVEGVDMSIKAKVGDSIILTSVAKKKILTNYGCNTDKAFVVSAVRKRNGIVNTLVWDNNDLGWWLSDKDFNVVRN